MLDPEEHGLRKKELADYLRELRKASGLTGPRLAARCGISQSKISKIETGKVLPSLSDVQRIIAALDVPDDIARDLESLVRVASTEFTDLRSSLRRGLHRKQGELAHFERSSSCMRFFLPTMLTGLLQTPDYVRASLETIPGDHARTIAKKLDRQDVLYDASKRFLFVLTEQSLRWPLCEPAAMSVQMGRLLALAELPNICIRVIPLSQPKLTEGPLCTFTIYDEFLVTAETFSGAVLMRDPRDISYHLDLFRTFEGYALTEQDTVELVTAVRDEFIR